MNRSKQGYNNVIGITFMLINAVAIAILYTAIKDLTKIYNSNLVVFIYKSLIFLCIIPWCLYGGWKGMTTNRLPLHALRGFLSVSGSLSLFYSIKFVSLADATALGYIEQVLLVIIGMTYFKERASKSKIFCVILSFLGALVIIYPDLATFEESSIVPKFFFRNEIASFNMFYLLIFMSVIFWTLNCTIVKMLGKTEKNKVQLFYGLFFQLVFAFPLAFLEWKKVSSLMSIPILAPVGFIHLGELTFSPLHCALLALLGVCYFAHSTSFFLALKYSELSTVIPLDYSRLVFTAILGYLFFDETPQGGAVIGYIFIIFAGVYLIRSEARYKKRLAKNKIIQLEDEFEHA